MIPGKRLRGVSSEIKASSRDRRESNTQTHRGGGIMSAAGKKRISINNSGHEIGNVQNHPMDPNFVGGELKHSGAVPTKPQIAHC